MNDYDDLVLSDVHVGKKTTVCADSSISRFYFQIPKYQLKYIQCSSSQNSVELHSNRSIQCDEDGDIEIISRKGKDLSNVENRKNVHSRRQSDITSLKDNFHCSLAERPLPGMVDLSETLDKCIEVVTLKHSMATPLHNVGKQIWRGALLLADYILHNSIEFREACCIELGAGVGLCSIVAGMFANTVYCTDIGDDILCICKENVDANDHLFKKGATVNVRKLNWVDNIFVSQDKLVQLGQLSSCEVLDEARLLFNWSCSDIKKIDDFCLILAADVIYDEYLTEKLFETIIKMLTFQENPSGNKRNHLKKIVISVEKRLNFTLIDQDVSCPAYNHFRSTLEKLVMSDSKRFPSLKGLQGKFHVQEIVKSIDQYFDYERVKELELWLIIYRNDY